MIERQGTDDKETFYCTDDIETLYKAPDDTRALAVDKTCPINLVLALALSSNGKSDPPPANWQQPRCQVPQAVQLQLQQHAGPWGWQRLPHSCSRNTRKFRKSTKW